MELTKTNRGFDIANFQDRDGNECSLQKSSIATEDCIWLGSSHLKVECHKPGDIGWTEFNIKKLGSILGYPEIISNCRMHLTQEQVKELIPYLQRFVETGELC